MSKRRRALARRPSPLEILAMLNPYILWVGRVSRLFAVIATALIVIAMLVVCQMILMRYVFRLPTIWQTDFVVFSATAAIFLGAPYVLLKGGHVGVDVVELMLGQQNRKRLRILGAMLGPRLLHRHAGGDLGAIRGGLGRQLEALQRMGPTALDTVVRSAGGLLPAMPSIHSQHPGPAGAG
jgi:hypothetical protein